MLAVSATATVGSRITEVTRSTTPIIAAPTEERSGDDWPGCVAVQRQSPSPVEPMLLTFAYPDGSTRLVVARILWCTRWQSYVTTGSYTRRITPQILTALPPVWMDYPDPDSMQVTR